MTAVQVVILVFPTERALFLREQSNRIYKPFPYFLGKSLSDLPTHVVFPILFALIIYWTVGLN